MAWIICGMLRDVFPFLRTRARARTHASADPRKHPATYRTCRGASESLGDCLRDVVSRRGTTSRNYPHVTSPEGPEVDANAAEGTVGPTVLRAHAFLGRVAATLTAKNRRYGDSAASPLRIFSRAEADEQLRVRIDDKLSRIAHARGADDEDTLLDLCGYLALLAAVGEVSREGRSST